MNKKNNTNEIVRSLAMVTQLGVSMMAPMILCVVVGNWLDEKYGWSTTVWLLILGILAGARNTWIMVKQGIKPTIRKRPISDESSDDKKESER